MKIFILSPSADSLFFESQLSQIKQAGEVVVEKRVVPFGEVPSLSEPGEKIIAIDPDFSGWSIPNEAIDAIPDLKAICLQSTAYDWIDLKHCAERKIAVTNVPGYSSESVAEWAVMMVMMLARKMPIVIRSGWKEDMSIKGMELDGKIAGIIGLGKIGTKMAKLCKGLGMKVQYWSRSSSNPDYYKVELKELYATSDVILVALVENEETKKLITDEMLQGMKPTAIVSSIFAVHRLYNHQMVLEMIKDKKIFGYGFEGHPEQFANFEGNVLATPSLAWYTEESLKRNIEIWVDNIVGIANGEYKNVVK
jgi:lactate dehydrogenase-like 2-hydroxyacid dehydrogenase